MGSVAAKGSNESLNSDGPIDAPTGYNNITLTTACAGTYTSEIANELTVVNHGRCFATQHRDPFVEMGMELPEGASGSDDEDEFVPHVLRWEHGGQRVCITGTFNNWARNAYMHRSGPDFTYIAMLRKNRKHAFKFIVDDEWRFSPDQPIVRDADGNINNYVDLSTFVHSDDMPIDLTHKASNPNLRWGQESLHPDEYNKDPPTLPPHLRDIVLNSASQDDDSHVIRAPLPVTLNHLYCTAFRDGLMVQGMSQRYRRKFVTTVFYSSVAPHAPPPATARSATHPAPPTPSGGGAGGGAGVTAARGAAAVLRSSQRGGAQLSSSAPTHR